MSTAVPSRAAGNHRDGSDPSVPSETTGPIASDSLAAESLKSGGDFAANDPSAAPLGVPGNKSTLNTTDTSGAVPLPPATSGAAREKAEARGLGDDEKGVTGGVKYPDAEQAKFDGTTTAEGGYYGGPSSDRQGQGYATTQQAAGASDFGASTTATTASSGGGSGSSSSAGITSSSSATTTGPSSSSSTAASGGGPSTGTGVRPHVPAAPTYAARVSGALTGSEGELQPKGSGLVEGGDVPEGKKTFTGNVEGGEKDPGRLAEQKFEGINARVAGGGGGVGGNGDGKEGTTEVGGQYGVLENERL